MRLRPDTLVRNAVLNDLHDPSIIDAMNDATRVCPMLAGASRIRGQHMVVRTAARDIEVRAPGALLDAMFAACDGTRTLAHIVASAPPSRRRDLRQFIESLIERGALVDAALATTVAWQYAHQGAPYGLEAPAKLSNRISLRFFWNTQGAPARFPSDTRRVATTPLDDLFNARVSTYTFGDGPPALESLDALLWSVAGVVHRRHERVNYVAPKRTIPSAGGMHLLTVYVALRVGVGPHAPGVYRVRYPDERMVALERVGDEIGLLPRAFTRPWELRFATGAIFVCADPRVAALRYRNRGLQYLFMEAGAALHNGGIAAPRLDLGYAMIGGYDEAVVSRLCGLTDEIVLGSAVFGPRPTGEQVDALQRTAEFEFTWVPTSSPRLSLPFHLARVRVKSHDDDRPLAWGRDADPWLACRKALAEAVEREGYRQPRGMVESSLANLPDAIDPRRFVLYSDAQYRRAGFPYRRFSSQEQHAWVDGVDLVSGERAFVLAELVFSRASLQDRDAAAHAPCTQMTSSGCAAGESRDDAILRALLELVERDAFMRHWLRQEAGAVVGRSRGAGEFAARRDTLQEAGCRVSVQRLDSPWAHVCMVAAQHSRQHFTTLGTAAHASFERAFLGALEELETRVYAWIHGQQPCIRNAAEVTSTEHHFELYGLKRHYRRADRVLFPEADGSPAPIDLTPSTCTTVSRLVDRFAASGVPEVAAIDISPERSRIDQGRTALVVMKALVPGLLPMSFGHGLEPRGLIGTVHPGSRFPHPFP